MSSCFCASASLKALIPSAIRLAFASSASAIFLLAVSSSASSCAVYKAFNRARSSFVSLSLVNKSARSLAYFSFVTASSRLASSVIKAISMSRIVLAVSIRFFANSFCFSILALLSAIAFALSSSASWIANNLRAFEPSLIIFFSASICSFNFLRFSALSLLAIFCNALSSFCELVKRFLLSTSNALLFAISKFVTSLPVAFAFAISKSYASPIFSLRFLLDSCSFSFALPIFSALASAS